MLVLVPVVMNSSARPRLYRFKLRLLEIVALEEEKLVEEEDPFTFPSSPIFPSLSLSPTGLPLATRPSSYIPQSSPHFRFFPTFGLLDIG